MTWVRTRAEGDEKSFVVLEGMLHDLPAWKKAILERMSVLMSQATRGQLAVIRENVRIEYLREQPILSIPAILEGHLNISNEEFQARQAAFLKEYGDKIARAEFLFTVNDERAARIHNLLVQEKRDTQGVLMPYSNAYRFTACHPLGGGMHQAVACLGVSVFKRRVNPTEGTAGTIKRTFDMIPATTGFQQLLQTYLQHQDVMVLPPKLRNGACQQVAQDAMSHLGQLDSGKVTGDVAFPTIETRDPVVRHAIYYDAIDALVGDLRKLQRTPLRQKYPNRFAEDDPRGDRMIVDDERWIAITRTPDPHPIPLFFVDGKAVTLLLGHAQFDAGISKKDRHRGHIEPNERVRQSRPASIQKKGYTGLQSFYAALPILDTDDPVIRDILRHHAELHASGTAGNGRGLDQGLAPMPLMHLDRWRRKNNEMLVLLSGNRDRFEHVLKRSDLEIAWTRLVQKDGEWYLQITLRVMTPKTIRKCPERILGVSFGIDAIATWCLMDSSNTVLQQGAFDPNQQILTFLKKKGGLEWDQEKQRWVGGRNNRFARNLESIAHGVVNDLVRLAQIHDAQLALEDIAYVPKQGRDQAQNLLFTAWNYGQMRRFGEYKAPLAHLDVPVFVSDYKTKFTCPSCGACRKAGQTPANATTWRENGTLHCRSCQQATSITPDMRAFRVAFEGMVFRRR